MNPVSAENGIIIRKWYVQELNFWERVNLIFGAKIKIVLKIENPDMVPDLEIKANIEIF